MAYQEFPFTAKSLPSQPRTLLIDADDTLWENNIYFERAIAAFISFLDHRSHTADEVRDHLNRCEHETISRYGYGLRSFRRSLMACFEQLAEVPITAETYARIVSFTGIIADAEIEVLPDVAETLTALRQRHRLIVVTKGDHDEQTSKLERSGLRGYFSAVEVVAEKTPAAYRRIALEYGCDPQRTWMIGNSPRSDINPALAAGLHAIYIPHHSTWVLEHEALDTPPAGQTRVELVRFAELVACLQQWA